MSKVSLSVNEEQLFGKFMPSINIERVTISRVTPSDDSDWEYGDLSQIRLQYALYITYPTELSEDEVSDWITDELGDLRVFVAFNPYPGFNRKVRRHQLMLHDLFRSDRKSWELATSYYDPDSMAIYEATRALPSDQLAIEDEEYDFKAVTNYPGYVYYSPAGTYRSWAYLNRFWRPFIVSYKISDLIASIGSDGVKSQFIYDDKGNRTVKLGDFTAYVNQWDWLYNRFSDYSIITFCGSFSPANFDLESAENILTSESPVAFQRRFGDISYIDVLRYNVVPYSTKKGFVYAATDQVYPGMPIQALDATYRDATEVSHEELKNKFAGLLSNFESLLSKSSTLTENYNSVAQILTTQFMNTDILRKLNRYRKSFTSKDPTTLTGRFYLAFQSLISSFNNLLMGQEEVKAVFYLNTRVIDTRREDYGVSYIAPLPAGGSSLSLSGDDFIPSKWVTYARMTEDTVPTHGALGDFAEFCLEEGFGTVFTATPSPEGEYLFSSDDISLMGSTSADLTPEEAETFGEAIGLDMESAREIYHEAWDESGVWSNGREGRAVTNNRNMDIVVKNKGLIHFDWEKACWTKSQLSNVLNLRRLKRYLGIEIPYAYFPVKKTTLIRKEHLLVTQLEDVMTMGSSSYFFDDGLISPGFAHVERNTEVDSLIARGYSNTNGVTVTIENIMKKNFVADAGVLSNVPYVAPHTEYNIHKVKPPHGYDTKDADTGAYVQPQHWKKYGYPWVGKTSLVPNLTAGDYPEGADAADAAHYIADAMVMNFSSLGGGSAFSQQIAKMQGRGDTRAWRLIAQALLGYGSSAPDAIDDLEFEVYAGTPSVTELHNDVKYSYVKFVNFDVMNPDPESTSENFALTDRFQDGYRLMSFEFQDYMDDDVAFYNTTGWEDNNAVGWNMEGEPTHYDFKVEVIDKSLLFYDQIYRKMKAEYDNFMIYYDYCHDKCSFNDNNLAFEDWFKDVALEEYPEPEFQPWLRAPVAFNALRMVLFGETAFDSSFSGDTTEAEEAMRLSTLMWVSKISPYSGRLLYLKHFRYWFANTLNMLYPQADLPQTVEALFSTEYDEMREVIESVDLTRPDGERRVVYDDSTGEPVLYGPGSSRASGYNAAYERMLNVSLLYDPHDPGSVDGTDVEYTFVGTGASSYLGSTKGDGGSDDHGGLYFSAINNFKLYEFSNSWEIDKEIFGDVRLSKIEADDYNPLGVGAGVTSVSSDVASYIDGFDEGYHGIVGDPGIILAIADDAHYGAPRPDLYDRMEVSWDLQRFRVIYNADDWTKDMDEALDGNSSEFGYFRQAGETIGIIHGYDKPNGILIPFEWFESKDYLGTGNGKTWNQIWWDVSWASADAGEAYGLVPEGGGLYYRDLDYTEKTYKEATIQLVYEIWNATVNRWVGVKYATVPIPMKGSSTGSNNWWAAKRTIMDMSGMSSMTYSDMSWIGQVEGDVGLQTVANASRTGLGMISTAMVARAFLRSRSDYNYEAISVLMDPRRGNTYDLKRSTYTPDPVGVMTSTVSPGTADYAYEAWKKGGNVIYFNLGQFQEKIGSYNGTGYDFRKKVPYQYNELLLVMNDKLDLSSAGYTKTGLKNNWFWAFDYGNPLDLDVED